MNEENPTSEQSPIGQPDESRDPSGPPAPDPRRRLRELLAIPERTRSDAEWDEIIALEIQLAPENRVGSGTGPSGRRSDPGRRPDQGRGGILQGRRDRPGGKPPRRFSKKSKRRQGSPINKS